MEPTRLGLVLDTSVVFAAERRGRRVQDIFDDVRATCGEVDIAISVVTIAELTHGAYRAKTREQQDRRVMFIERLASDVPVHPVTIEIARLAGRVEGQQAAKGIQIAFEDLLIAVTALHLDYDLAMLNVRDFQRVPNLNVIRF